MAKRLTKDKNIALLQYDEPGYAREYGMGTSIDDLGIRNVEDFHIERMADNNYWMGITCRDGKSYRFWIGCKSERARVDAVMERDA